MVCCHQIIKFHLHQISCQVAALPFLVRSELLLAPLLPLFTAYIISLVGFNVAQYVLPLYFGS